MNHNQRMSISDAADFLNVSEEYVRSHIANGELLLAPDRLVLSSTLVKLKAKNQENSTLALDKLGDFGDVLMLIDLGLDI